MDGLIVLLWVSLLILLYIAYIKLEKILISPSLLFILGLFLASSVALFYCKEWKLGLHVETYFLITSGCVAFLITEIVYGIYNRLPKPKDSYIFRPSSSSISDYKLLLFLLLQLYAYYQMAQNTMALASAAMSLTESINDLDSRAKLEDEIFEIPAIVRYPYMLCQNSTQIFACLIPYYYYNYKKKKITLSLLSLNFLLASVGSLFSGGRMIVLNGIIALSANFYIFSKIKSGWKEKFLSVRTTLLLIVSAIIFSLSFYSFGNFIGRTSENQYVIPATYCGAEIKNLDIFLQRPWNTNTRGVFLESSMYRQWNDIFLLLGEKEKPISHKDWIPFQSVGRYSLGNVYTAFQNYFMDLGYFAFVACIIMSLILSFVFRKALQTNFWRTGKLNYWILLYSLLIYTSFMSFFSEMFFARLSIKSIFSSLVYWSIVMIYLQGNVLSRTIKWLRNA